MGGSFTCREFGTWDRLFNFPSEGRHAEDFYIQKNLYGCSLKEYSDKGLKERL
jgi:hypothetical protein